MEGRDGLLCQWWAIEQVEPQGGGIERGVDIDTERERERNKDSNAEKNEADGNRLWK